jgi:DNA-binding CsgD family transcriptional regulator
MRVEKRPEKEPVAKRKSFAAVLGRFLSESVPGLRAELVCNAVVTELIKLIDEYLPAMDRLRPGQVMWYPVATTEKGGYGKSIENSKLVPVMLDLITEQDIEDQMQKIKKRERQKTVAVRLHSQAYEQGGVMTYADTAAIMRLSPATVGIYIREYERETGNIVPRRGNIHDMGPTLTHKRIICIKHLKEGKTVEQTAWETDHSPEAITRYVNDFKRVWVCLKEGWTLEKITTATGLSEGLANQYIEMIEENDQLITDETLPF